MAKKVGYAKYRLSPLKKITDRAKQIRKQKPSMPWKTAIEKSSAEYRSVNRAKPVKKKSAVKKRVVKKVAAKKVSRSAPKKRVAKKAAVNQGKLFGRSKVEVSKSESLYIYDKIKKFRSYVESMSDFFTSSNTPRNIKIAYEYKSKAHILLNQLESLKDKMNGVQQQIFNNAKNHYNAFKR